MRPPSRERHHHVNYRSRQLHMNLPTSGANLSRLRGNYFALSPLYFYAFLFSFVTTRKAQKNRDASASRFPLLPLFGLAMFHASVMPSTTATTVKSSSATMGSSS